MHSVGTACCVQAQACLSTGPRLTVVFLTFSVLAQGIGGGGVRVNIFFYKKPCEFRQRLNSQGGQSSENPGSLVT